MTFENRILSELKAGDTASIERLCRSEDLIVFAHASGNHNPLHLPREDGSASTETVAPAMWVASLISSVLGNILPGPGALYRSQSLSFHDRAHAGDTLLVTVTVVEKSESEGTVTLDTEVTLRDGRVVVNGRAVVMAPTEKVRFDDGVIPDLTVQRHVHFDAMLEEARSIDPTPTAVISPESADALEGALLGMRHTLISPILVGDVARIEALARELGESLSGCELIDAPNPDEAAACGVELVHEGRARAMMKGHLHTDVLLHHVVKRDGGLRTRRRLSHVFVLDVPGLNHLLMITDAAINIAPDLDTKVDITQNAIDLAHALGIEMPRVGVLSALETVNPKIPSTMDAAILAKMADRGQITGGIVDGPLAMDNAMSANAARIKGLQSSVAGRADILVAPNLESANMISKELTFLAHAEAGGVVLGAKCPIILTSRADDEKARLASCAVAALYAEWREGRRAPAERRAAE